MLLVLAQETVFQLHANEHRWAQINRIKLYTDVNVEDFDPYVTVCIVCVYIVIVVIVREQQEKRTV